jgi:hypothetical protein
MIVRRIRADHSVSFFARTAAAALALLTLTADPVLCSGTSTGVPYREGNREHLPSAAAELRDMACTCLTQGWLHSFTLHVFASCWTLVYSVEIIDAGGTGIEPYSWPPGWTATGIPQDLGSSDRVVFSTVTDPIAPGTCLSGFGVTSSSPWVVVRWYPADGSGSLIGKMSRLQLSCPTSAEPVLWGSLKALYR